MINRDVQPASFMMVVMELLGSFCAASGMEKTSKLPGKIFEMGFDSYRKSKSKE